MSTLGIILTILILLFAVLEVSALIQHWFEHSRGVFIIKNEKQKRQIILHSTFDQMAIGLIVNYESGFFISLHILNLHFCFVYIPKEFRPSHPAMAYVQEKPTIDIVEWMRNGIDKAEENFPGAQSEFYFRAFDQGYTIEDIDKALKHWRAIGAKAYWDMNKQEIILNIPNGNNN